MRPDLVNSLNFRIARRPRRRRLVDWLQSMLLLATVVAVTCPANGQAPAQQPDGRVISLEHLRERRPANLFKLIHGRGDDLCNVYGRSLAVPADRWPSAHGLGRGHALNRSRYEVPFDDTERTPDVVEALKGLSIGGGVFLQYVDYDNTNRPSLVLLWDGQFGRSIMLPPPELRDKLYPVTDPKVRDAITKYRSPAAESTIVGAYRDFEPSAELKSAMDIAGRANSQPRLSFYQAGGLNYYLFVKVRGKLLLSGATLLDTERPRGTYEAYVFLIELRPSQAELLRCVYRNAISIVQK